MTQTLPEESETLSDKDVHSELSSFAPKSVADSGVTPAWKFIEVSEPPTRELLYGATIHTSLRTLKPFRVTFEESENGIAAIVSDLDEYGFGSNRSEAIEDLRHTLSELYFSLDANHTRLSSDLSSVWALLRSHLVRTRV